MSQSMGADGSDVNVSSPPTLHSKLESLSDWLMVNDGVIPTSSEVVVGGGSPNDCVTLMGVWSLSVEAELRVDSDICESVTRDCMLLLGERQEGGVSVSIGAASTGGRVGSDNAVPTLKFVVMSLSDWSAGDNGVLSLSPQSVGGGASFIGVARVTGD